MLIAAAIPTAAKWAAAKRDLLMATYAGWPISDAMRTATMIVASGIYQPEDVKAGISIRTAAALALLEVVAPRLCRRCAGRKELRGPHGAVRECEACAGTGRGRTSEREAAHAMQCSRHVWRMQARKFSRLVNTLHAWNAEAIAGWKRKVS